MADLTSDVMGSVEAVEGIAKVQMQLIKEVHSFRVGEEEKFVAVFTHMYNKMLQDRKDNVVLTEEQIEAEKQQAEFEQALRNFTEVKTKDNYYCVKLVELELGLQEFVNNYN